MGTSLLPPTVVGSKDSLAGGLEGSLEAQKMDSRMMLRCSFKTREESVIEIVFCEKPTLSLVNHDDLSPAQVTTSMRQRQSFQA
jgi:hypothetical protein